jgi:hypothetical protein
MQKMKTITVIPSAEMSPNNRKSLERLHCCLLKHLIIIILAAFLLMIVSPVNASTDTGKNKKSECRHKVVSFSYPVIVTKKNNPMIHKKHLKKSRNRKYSFPV